MRFLGFIGPSYQLASLNVDCQRCINMYPELDEIGTGKEREIASLKSTPGLTLVGTVGTGPIRGMYLATNGVFYVASGTGIYIVSSSFASTLIATLTTASGPVSIVDNGLQIVFVDGTTGWWSTLGTTTSTQFLAANGFQGASQVSFMDGYFIFLVPNSNTIFCSDLYAITFNLEDISFQPSSNAQNIIGQTVDHQNIWLFKEKTVDIYYDQGGTPPFVAVSGAFMEIGIVAQFSLVKCDNTLFWLGGDSKGWGIVYQVSGYQPQRVSTHAVETAINSYGNIAGAVAYSYQQNGHAFYVINFPNANSTWVYDVTTQLWHERVYTSQGQFQRHLVQYQTFVFQMQIGGDYQSGNLYSLTDSVYTDNGAPITRQRISPHMTSDLKRLTYHSFQLDIEAGVGLDGIGQGTNPQAVLQFSDDGGHSWSNEKWATFGAIGKRFTRALWRRLGRARDRVYKLTITDPVPVRMIGATLRVTEEAS
jgi:hypothetical protein